MVSFTSLCVALVAAVGAVASPVQLASRGISPGTGQHGGYFYSFWTDNQGNVDYNNEAGGRYRVTWNRVNNWVGGKGWNPGPPKVVNYTGTWNNYNVNSYLALYGWTTNPLVEYYIVEAFGSYNPASQAQKKGSITSDGGTYDIYQTTRNNQPSILGTSTFPQFWSVRTQKRVGGTINTQAHFNAWTQSGLRLGQWNYMIMATEGYQSSGSADITVLN
jgi:endo-1,4-beta-xylanase